MTDTHLHGFENLLLWVELGIRCACKHRRGRPIKSKRQSGWRYVGNCHSAQGRQAQHPQGDPRCSPKHTHTHTHTHNYQQAITSWKCMHFHLAVLIGAHDHGLRHHPHQPGKKKQSVELKSIEKCYFGHTLQASDSCRARPCGSEWMNGWTDERMNGWTDERMNEWMSEWMDKWING